MREAYVTYFSRNKIDNLLSAYQTKRPVEWKELEKTNNDVSASLGFFKLFKFIWGDKKATEIEMIHKPDYVNRLQVLLKKIANDIKVFSMPAHDGVYDAKFYIYTGTFRLENYDDTSQIVSLIAVENDCRLILNGSMANFNDDPLASRFTGAMPSHMAVMIKNRKSIKYEVLFILQHHTSTDFEGTPIYMILV
jgi:hypothetical protein